MFNRARRLSWLFHGVKARLIGMILVTVLPLILARAVGLYHERNQEIEAAGLQAHELARRGADYYREVAFESETLLKIIANVREVMHGSPESCAAFLERAGQDRTWADSVWVFGIDGRARCSTAPNGFSLDVSDRDFFRQALKTRMFFVSQFTISEVRQTPISVAALPVLDAKGEVAGVVAITLRPTWFYRFVSEIVRSVDPTVWFVDGQGRLLAHYPKRPELVGKDFQASNLVKDMQRPGTQWSDLETADGARRIYGYVPVPGSDAHIAVGLDRATVLADVDKKIERASQIVVAALLIALIVGFAMAHTVAKPLAALTAGAEKARLSPDGDLPAVKGYQEIDSLARSLNELLAERRRREEALNAARTKAERATEEAQAAHARLSDAIEAVPAGIAILDAEDRFVLWNSRYAEIYADAGAVVRKGMTFEERLRAGVALGMFPNAAGHEEEWLAERLAIHRAEQSSHEQRLPDDRWLRIEERRMRDGGSVGVRIDITNAKRREQTSRLLFEGNPVPMWVFDRETLRFLAVNDAAIEHYGYSREQFAVMTLLDIRDPQYRDLAREAASAPRVANGERVWRHRKADGSEALVNVFARPVDYEGRPAKIAALIDVTERRRDEARIIHMAHYDSLTDLANRSLFRARIDNALARTRGSGAGLALHCIDLDRFKDVNDTLGHPVGDALLRMVAQRLQNAVRPSDTVGRLGGDEFAVLQDPIAGDDDAGALAQRLIATLSAPYDIDGHAVMVTPGLGIATVFDGDGGADELLSHADMALYRAKACGRGSHCFFSAEMNVANRARRALETDLRAAIANEELELNYQPLIDLSTSDPIGFEALLRWRHPERGMVPPAEFIPIAEEIGLVVPLGEWVLRTGCAEAVKWPVGIAIAINLSPLQFKSGNLVETVRAALAESGLSPHRLELEITETVLLEDNDVNHAILHQLRNLGVRIAMDDFGTGYSSLSYLRSFPFDKIKIDRSFVRELPDRLDCMTITRGIVELAAGLGMETTAEGVETPEQLYVLKTYGCTQGQGFLFSRPLPASGVATLLASCLAEACADACADGGRSAVA